MTTPASLKPITPFLAKAKETQTADPIISYHCKLYAAQQIVDQGLHQKDTEAAIFTGNLLDEIEKLKEEDPVLVSEKGQAVIADDTVASSYVEAFALKIFARADKQVREKSSSKATAQMFFAAATFFEVCKLFGDLDKDVVDKIKYSKFHAARILRTLKAGEDPNEFTVEDEDDVIDDVLDDGNEPAPKEPTTEEEEAELPEEEQIKRMMAEMKKEVGGSDSVGDNDSVDPHDSSGFHNSSFSKSLSSHDDPFSNIPPAPPTFLPEENTPPAPPSNPPGDVAPPKPTLPSPQRKVSSPAKIVAAPVDPKTVLDEDALIKQAQKHAKFAISALNYEDKETALKELQAAMDLLST
ncbi:Vacuolar protein sorting-associated protein VTA1-like protein [Yarrowia sp. C11]|nr:Vacuolar protein sorting-associated protein VTA1-like protein [Yarrowia sp. E02]KAG5371565.1 Vacuolar protein sorting-associated protein VTA1-like protein [Yarrowia sp. C11]